MTPPPPLDAIVVGSGFGGGVSTMRLAERGLNVLLLERGPWWHQDAGGDTRSPTSRSYPRGVLGMRRMMRSVHWTGPNTSRSAVFRRDGLWELHQFDQLSCLVASGMGGGSLVYTNMQVEPPAPFFDHFPPEITATEMRPHYVTVATMLGITPDPVTRRKTQAFTHAVRSQGLGDVEYPPLAVDFSGGGHGNGAAGRPCLLGSDDDTKRSIDRTYLADAHRHGAQLQPLSEVVGIGRTDDQQWCVRYTDHQTGGQHVVRAPRLILCAGTLNTLRLLFAARDRQRTLPHLGATLGRGFTPNGDMVSYLHRSRLPLHSDFGPSTSAFHRQTREGRNYLTGEFGLPLHALPLPPVLTRGLRHSAVLFGMGADTVAATITYDGHELHTTASQADDAHLFTLLRRHAETIAAGYQPHRAFTNAPFGGSRRLTSVHPLGGAAIADDPTRGVVDHTGQVFGHPGLYVADGSALPAAPGVPPSMTIAALAERQSHFISQDPHLHRRADHEYV